MSNVRIGGPEARLYEQMRQREQREAGFRRVVRALRLGEDAATLREHAEGMARILASVQYRSPREDMLPECVGCGAMGPIPEHIRHLYRPDFLANRPEPCKPECEIGSALSRWREGPGREKGAKT